MSDTLNQQINNQSIRDKPMSTWEWFTKIREVKKYRYFSNQTIAMIIITIVLLIVLMTMYGSEGILVIGATFIVWVIGGFIIGYYIE